MEISTLIILVLQIIITTVISIALYLYKQKDTHIGGQFSDIKEKQYLTDKKIAVVEDNIDKINLKLQSIEKDILIQITAIKGSIDVLNERNTNIRKDIGTIVGSLKYVKKRRQDT